MVSRTGKKEVSEAVLLLLLVASLLPKGGCSLRGLRPAGQEPVIDPSRFSLPAEEQIIGRAEPLVSTQVEALKRGMRGEKVLRLQQFLKDVRLYSGPLSGIFDAKTERAVKEFQRIFGVKPDGVVGPSTARVIALVMQGEIS